jgi:hypothetical protein
MNAVPLTPELYNELKQENYKYLVFKRALAADEEGVWEPVKELPNHFVISLNGIEDEVVKVAMAQNKLLIDY